MGRASSLAGWSRRRKLFRTSRYSRIPVWEINDRQDGIFPRSDFHWDRKRGAYICPNRKLLQTSGTAHDGRTLLSRASKRDCDVCPVRAECCTTADARKIPRHIHEDARNIARRKMKTKAFAKSRDERKRVEMRFARLKTRHGFERMRLRGLSGARDEFHLAARTLKHLRSGQLGRHQPGGARSSPETAHGWISRVRVKVDPHRDGFNCNRPAAEGVSRSEDPNPKQQPDFSTASILSGRSMTFRECAR